MKTEVDWKTSGACVSARDPDESWKLAAFADFRWFKQNGYIYELGESVEGALKPVFKRVIEICKGKGIKRLCIAAVPRPFSREEELCLLLGFKPADRIPLSVRREIQKTRFSAPYSVLVYQIGG